MTFSISLSQLLDCDILLKLGSPLQDYCEYRLAFFCYFNPKLTHKLYSQLILISFLLLYQLNCLVDLLFQFAQIYFSWNLLSRLFSGEICFKCSLILLFVNSLRLRFLILWISASYYYFEDKFYSLDCESRCIEPPAKSQSLD